MKIIYLTGCFCLVLLLASACKKKPFDDRNKYLGDWEFRVERTEFNMDSVGHYEHDTLIYLGEISYGEGDDQINIHYTPEDAIQLIVTEDGQLSGFPTHYCSGSFEGSNKLQMYLRWGGLGAGIYHVVDGEKK